MPSQSGHSASQSVPTSFAVLFKSSPLQAKCGFCLECLAFAAARHYTTPATSRHLAFTQNGGWDNWARSTLWVFSFGHAPSLLVKFI